MAQRGGVGHSHLVAPPAVALLGVRQRRPASDAVCGLGREGGNVSTRQATKQLSNIVAPPKCAPRVSSVPRRRRARRRAGCRHQPEVPSTPSPPAGGRGGMRPLWRACQVSPRHVQPAIQRACTHEERRRCARQILCSAASARSCSPRLKYPPQASYSSTGRAPWRRVWPEGPALRTFNAPLPEPFCARTCRRSAAAALLVRPPAQPRARPLLLLRTCVQSVSRRTARRDRAATDSRAALLPRQAGNAPHLSSVVVVPSADAQQRGRGGW